jgi:GNAT superfamily N-acetyltransferase
MTTKTMALKPAGPESADIFVAIHFDAVNKGNAARFYDAQILDDWSPPVSEERIQDFRRKLSETRPMALLAYLDDTPAGFGIYDPEQMRIGAIYVKAAYTRCNVGTSLLRAFEKSAIQNGGDALHLESSLNARAFYERNGFVCVSEGIFRFDSGKQMKSVAMLKRLASSFEGASTR